MRMRIHVAPSQDAWESRERQALHQVRRHANSVVSHFLLNNHGNQRSISITQLSAPSSHRNCCHEDQQCHKYLLLNNQQTPHLSPPIPFALPMSHHSFCVWPILFPKPVSNHYCKQHPPVTAAASIADQQPSMFMTMAAPSNATVLVAYQQKQFCSV